MLAFLAPRSIFGKRCCRLRWLKNFRPKVVKKDLLSWIMQFIGVVLYFLFVVLVWFIWILLYLVVALLILSISYALLLPLFYIYSIIILIRKIIIWRGVRSTTSRELTPEVTDH